LKLLEDKLRIEVFFANISLLTKPNVFEGLKKGGLRRLFTTRHV